MAAGNVFPPKGKVGASAFCLGVVLSALQLSWQHEALLIRPGLAARLSIAFFYDHEALFEKSLHFLFSALFFLLYVFAKL